MQHVASHYFYAANNTWKTLRKAAMTMLKPDNADNAKPLQRAEAAQLMWDMLNNPQVCARYVRSIDNDESYNEIFRTFMMTSVDLQLLSF